MLQLEKFDYLCALINKVISSSGFMYHSGLANEFISSGIKKVSLTKPHHKT